MGDPKLGKRQFELLEKVIKSNGGGVFAEVQDRRTVIRLAELGLIQGKSGQLTWAVHTRDGLELYRKLTKAEVSCE